MFSITSISKATTTITPRKRTFTHFGQFSFRNETVPIKIIHLKGELYFFIKITRFTHEWNTIQELFKINVTIAVWRMLIIYTKRRTGTSQESKRGTTQTSKNKHERHALWFLLCALCGCFLPVSNIKNIRLMNKLSLRPRAALNIFLSITSSFFTLFFAISLKYPCKDCTSASLKLVVSTNWAP